MIGRDIEAKVALGALEAELDGIALFDAEAGCTDFEGLGRAVGTLVEELGGVGSTFHVLRGQPRDHAHG